MISNDNINIRKKISGNNIAPILELILKNDSIEDDGVYKIKALLACVTCYPAFCGSRKSLIEQFVLVRSESASSQTLEVLFKYLLPFFKKNTHINFRT